MRLRLREVRERRFVTQAERSARTGIAAATLSRLEHGRQRPRSSTVRTIAAALDVPPDELTVRGEHGNGGKAAA